MIRLAVVSVITGWCCECWRDQSGMRFRPEESGRKEGNSSSSKVNWRVPQLWLPSGTRRTIEEEEEEEEFVFSLLLRLSILSLRENQKRERKQNVFGIFSFFVQLSIFPCSIPYENVCNKSAITLFIVIVLFLTKRSRNRRMKNRRDRCFSRWKLLYVPSPGSCPPSYWTNPSGLHPPFHSSSTSAV